MECGSSQERIVKLGCGHLFCDHCFDCFVSDSKTLGFTFAVKCRLRYCYYIATYRELENILGTEACKSAFSGELQANSNADSCLLCTKRDAIVLHDKHALCKNCMLGYAEYLTHGEFIQMDPERHDFVMLPCPALNCASKFSCNHYLNLLPNTVPYTENAFKRIGIYNPQDVLVSGLDEKMKSSLQKGKCFKCGEEKNIASLHPGCSLCFCKNDAKSLGSKLLAVKCKLFATFRQMRAL